MRPGGRADHPIELLSAAMDRELKPDEAAAFEAHLEGCAECRGLQTDFRRLDEAIASEPPPAVPAGLQERIQARLPSRAVPAPARPFWRQAMPMAAAATLFTAILVWYGRPAVVPLQSPDSATAPEAAATPPDLEEKPKSLRDEGLKQGLLPPPPPPAPPPTQGRSVPPATDSVARAQLSKDGASSPKRAADGWSANSAPTPSASRPAEPSGEDEIVRSEKAAEKKDRQQLPSVEKDMEELRALGYLGSGPAQVVSGAPAPPPTSPAKENVPAPTARAGSVGAATPAAMMAAQAKTPAYGLLVTPYTLRFVGDRLLLVESGAYACVTAVDESDRRLLAAAIQEGLAGRPSGSQAGTDAPADAGAVKDDSLVVPAAPQAREAILRLVRERYRQALEDRCGPLPQ